MTDSHTITFTEPEITVIRVMATNRHLAARGGHAEDRQRGHQNAVQIDIDGIMGEFALARMMNVYPDFTAYARNGGADLMSRDGLSIDVKTTRYADGQLLGEVKKKDAPCDVYVLMIVDDRSARFAGWISGKRLFRDDYLTDLGHGPTYAVPQDQLRREASFLTAQEKTS